MQQKILVNIRVIFVEIFREFPRIYGCSALFKLSVSRLCTGASTSGIPLDGIPPPLTRGHFIRFFISIKMAFEIVCENLRSYVDQFYDDLDGRKRYESEIKIKPHHARNFATAGIEVWTEEGGRKKMFCATKFIIKTLAEARDFGKFLRYLGGWIKRSTPPAGLHWEADLFSTDEEDSDYNTDSDATWIL